VEVMANCRKKPRQIVELSGQVTQVRFVIATWETLFSIFQKKVEGGGQAGGKENLS